MPQLLSNDLCRIVWVSWISSTAWSIWMIWSWFCTAEEHLHRLHVVFNCLREYNLKLKPSKCSFFREEINYLAHQVSKWGVWPSDNNIKAITEYTLPQTYTEIRSFLGLIHHYRRFIKGFVRIAQPLNEHLAGEGASRKSEWVSLAKEALEAFKALKQACMNSPVLAFANYTKDFLLETDASKERLGAVFSQKQEDRRFHLVAYGSQALTMHEKNYHSIKLEFLALKWAVTEHFMEYVLYQPFLVKTDNNPLTYIMTTHNLDATGHQWVSALAKYDFQLEYQKGQDKAVADALSWVTTCLEPEAVQAVLDGATMGASQRAEGENPAIIKSDQQLEKEVQVATGQVLVEMHVTDWAVAQKGDPQLDAVLQWLESKKRTDLRTLLGECIMSKEGWMVWRNCQNFTTLRGTLYLHSTPKGENEDLLLFMVPKVHQTATLNGCHREAGHQGHDRTLSLLQECFWWPGMAKQMRQVIKACRCCLQYEGGTPKAPLCPIVATTLLDLLHVDFTSIETMMELDQSPRVTIVLVFQDYFTKHVLAYVTPNQTAKTIAKFLYGGYISIFGALARLLSDRGTSFTSSIIEELCKILGIQWLWTMPYHPQTNGLVERDHTRQLCTWLGSWEKTRKPTGHHIWLK